MSNSQEQSLDPDVVFLPVDVSSPEFVHCERERRAVEHLLSCGPSAFYSALDQEQLDPFLSPEEAGHISRWARPYRASRVRLENGQEEEEDGEEEEEEEEDGSAGVQGFSHRYFPTHSDTPAPLLELGWPERVSWVGRVSATVHTSPPAEGQPPLREVLRRLLRGATKVIAIATDKLTDSAVTYDLHQMASQGVPVYIILNHRAVQDDFTPNRLRHPNIQVRLLGGRTFCSREGRMVEGEMKNSFLLVDLETVVQGSYSLTWSDAHLHRQLVTVLRGPVVESFDREFRILFAASQPLPATGRVVRSTAEARHHSEFSDMGQPRYLPPEPVLRPLSPPPPCSPLDWEALGVIQRDRQTTETPVNPHTHPRTPDTPFSPYTHPRTTDTPFDPHTHRQTPDTPFDPHARSVAVDEPLRGPKVPEKKTTVAKEIDRRITAPLDERSTCVNPNFVTKNLRDNQASLKNRLHFETDLQRSAEREIPNRVQSRTERSYFRQLSNQRSSESDDIATSQAAQYSTQTSSGQEMRHSRDRPIRREDLLDEELPSDSPPSSRRPLILRVPQTDCFSSLSDILKRLQPRQSASAGVTRGSRTTVSELSRSMMDLSRNHDDTGQERDPPVPRLQASYFDSRMTPALALIRKRSDAMKSEFLRQPKSFIPPPRPRSSSFGLQREWRRPQTHQERQREDAE